MGNKKKAKKEVKDSKCGEIEQPSMDKFPSLEESNNIETREEKEERSTKSAEREKPRKYGDIELKMKKKGQKKAPSVEKEVEEEPKYSKRKIVSNWERYKEERERQRDEEEEMKGADYTQLLDFGGSGSHFQLQSETLWESENFGAFDLSVDTALVLKALNCIPLHERFKLQPQTLPDDIVQELKREAFEVSKSYYESAGKIPPEFKEEILEPELEDELVLMAREATVMLECESKEVPSLDAQEDPNTTETPKVDASSNESVSRPQDARQKRERRPRRTHVQDNPPLSVESPVAQERSNIQPPNSVEDTKSEIVKKFLDPATLPVGEPAMKENVSEEKKVPPEELEKSDSTPVVNIIENKKKPCVVSFPRKETKPQENLDDLLSLTKPINRHDDESDIQVLSEETPKEDVTVASIQQTTTSASLEDWLDSILD